jgi:predicted aldo/keto reductase-like oxidoreductase
MSSSKRSEFRLGGQIAVSRIGFGAMRLSTNGFRGPARDPEAGRAVLRRAVELGVNLIDTAGRRTIEEKHRFTERPCHLMHRCR